jgi:hypothetical protein
MNTDFIVREMERRKCLAPRECKTQHPNPLIGKTITRKVKMR